MHYIIVITFFFSNSLPLLKRQAETALEDRSAQCLPSADPIQRESEEHNSQSTPKWPLVHILCRA